MDIEAGEIYIGPFVALGADIGIPPDGVHRGIVVVDCRDGFRAVTLTTGDSCPGGVEIPGLAWVALDARGSFVKLESSMGIR